jgi:hypothetical protein
MKNKIISWRRYGIFIGRSPIRLFLHISSDLLLGIIEIIRWKFNRNFKKIIPKQKIGHKLLIIANGPSVNKINFSKFINDNNVEIMVMNDFYSSDLAKEIDPNIYIITDNFYIENLQHDKVKNLLEYLNEKGEIEIAIPYEFKKNWQLKIDYELCTSMAPRIFRMINPNAPHSYGHWTSLRALALAQYLGYDKIFLIGYDNTHLLNIKVDKNNDTLWLEYSKGAHHFYNDSDFEKLEKIPSKIFSDGVLSILETQAILIDDLNMFSKERIINLDPDSWTTPINKII